MDQATHNKTVIGYEIADLFQTTKQNVSLHANDQPLLDGAGTISREDMERTARERYDTFDSRRRTEEAARADAEDIKVLEDLEQDLQRKGGRA